MINSPGTKPMSLKPCHLLRQDKEALSRWRPQGKHRKVARGGCSGLGLYVPTPESRDSLVRDGHWDGTCVPEDMEGRESLYSQDWAAAGLYAVFALICVTFGKWLMSL